MGKSFNSLCEEMLNEWFGDRKKFKKIFDSSAQNFDPSETFHRLCHKTGPNVTIFYSSDDSIFGGYTSQGWKPEPKAGYKRDTKAFLFKLYCQGTFQPKKYPVEYPRYAIYCDEGYGPTFGGTSDEKTKDIEVKLDYQRGFSVRTALGQAYNTGKASNEDFTCHGGKVNTFEVYQVIDDDEYIERASRNVTDISVETLKKDLRLFQPCTRCINHVNILLVGQIGAGKSSYLNSIMSAFKGYVSSSVGTGSAITSLTLKNEEYKVYSGPERNPLNFLVWDTKGIEQPVDQSLVDGLIHIIKGRPPSIMNILVSKMSDLWYGKRQPRQTESEVTQDRVHCVVFVIDGSVLSVLPRNTKEAMERIKTFANSCGMNENYFN